MRSPERKIASLQKHFGSVMLYPRGPRRFGTRGHILILASTFCTLETARMIHAHFADVRFGPLGENRVILLEHETGCCSVGIDENLAHRVLRNASVNPNVARVVVISLGCGAYCSTANSAGNSTRTGKLIKTIQAPVRQEEVVVQAPGSRNKAVSQGVQIIKRMIREIEQQERVETTLASLFPGVMNGSSDPTSGLYTNPSVGYYSDFLLGLGGRIAFSQTTEMVGAESLIVPRAGSDSTRHQIMRLLSATTMMRRAVEEEGVECEPTQGNIRSGISTLAEKSVGTIFKIGTSADHQIVDVVPHGKAAGSASGIYLIDGPGQDVLAMSGLVAAGANVVLFTTGRGAPTGSPIAPTVKITANETTAANMPDVIDIRLPVNEIFEKQRPLQELALEVLVPEIHAIASGKLTKAEEAGQKDFQVRQMWPID